ncbi:hypothetical protein WJ47_21465 [Burkholderia ubonensis]|uniref:UrcA family protein n=1 Tax=Burkholderia ubonensis TaxID=101571 RepID=A0AB73FVC5_9BURK|nr:hypothetical protein [Burkholderia ubonensis]KVK83856.1 hypothetical protein WJ44_06265 [Burkholderia ubonensis]KVL82896.1 hypothetical protein WJ47_21465 [Burkholderia ubonensis]KVM23893.1 hypothetical protein WJ53_17305 [Burkholderia ubonensis]KVM35396.1 hypothetical protein WJ54_35675 [Burkholderia ubonensis]
MKRFAASALLFATLALTSVGAAALELDARPTPLMGVPVMTGLPPLHSPAVSAESRSSVRVALKSLAPFVYDALQTIEARRGARYADSEIASISSTPEFQAETERARERFCAVAANSTSLACARGATDAARQLPIRPREDDVVVTAKKTLSRNEEVMVSP